MQTFHHPLSPEEESHYLQKAKAGDLSARNILVEYNLRLVAHIVKKYQDWEPLHRGSDFHRHDRPDQSDQYI